MGIPVKVGDIISCNVLGDTSGFAVRFNFNFRVPGFIPGTFSFDGQTLDVPATGGVTALVSSNREVPINQNLEIETAGVEGAGGATLGTPPSQPGRLYVNAVLKRGGSVICRILAGYFSSRANPSYPGIQHDPGEGPGFLITASGTAPAVATDISDTVPNFTRWRLRAIEAALVTDGNAANRTVNLFADDAQAPLTRRLLLTDTTAQTASLTRTHGWYPGNDTPSTASVSVVDGAITILAKYPNMLNDPGVFLTAGNRIRTITASIQVGDQWGAARYWVEQWVGIG